MKKIIATTVVIASVCGFLGGREILAEETSTHAVQKGDTLWDLSGGYLNDPLLWPKIWKVNPGIANPHRIKPGQAVKIPGKKKKAPVREASAGSVVVPVETGSSALARAGLASSSEPLPIVVVNKDAASTVQKGKAVLMADPAQYYDRGIGMVTNDMPSGGKVLRTEQGWQGAGLGDTILISAPGAQVGQQFGVYRDMGKVDALSFFSASPGHLLADVGIVEVVASDATRQQAVVRRAYAEVRTDDVLGEIPARPAVSGPSVPAASVKGAVVAFHFMRQMAAPDDILYLNIGADQGLAPGDLLSVTGEDKAEGRNAGEIMVLRVSPTTAAAVVTKRSGHEVRRGDVVGPPRM
jgi:LysM repeat protein